MGARARFATYSALLVLSASLLVACTQPAAEPAAPAPSGGMMGGSGGGDMASGVIAAAANASITVGATPATSRGIPIDRVLAPADGWLVVRSLSEPGAVLGRVAVSAGETHAVIVPVSTLDGPRVRVSLLVDRGIRGEFGFDPNLPERNTDKPVFADELPVEALVDIPAYGVTASPNSVLILVEDQRIGPDGLNVRYLLAPGPYWICVNVIEDGLPGRRIGLLGRGGGESQEVYVPLEVPSVKGKLLVTLFADEGTRDRFDYDPTDPLGSKDRPYLSAGIQVSQVIIAR